MKKTLRTYEYINYQIYYLTSIFPFSFYTQKKSQVKKEQRGFNSFIFSMQIEHALER